MYLYLSKLNYLFEKFLRKIFPKTIYIKIFYAKNKLLGLDNSFKHFTDEQIFENIYKNATWGRDESGNGTSGDGSHLISNIKPYIETIEDFLGKKKKYSLLDIGCGDFNVGKNFVKFSNSFIACDISNTILKLNREKYFDNNVKFKRLNITKDKLPKAEIAFIRQVLQHLSNEDIKKFANRIKNENPFEYLIVTEHVSINKGYKPNLYKPSGPGIRIGINSGIELDKSPFNLPYAKKRVLLEIPQNEYEFESSIKTTMYHF